MLKIMDSLGTKIDQGPSKNPPKLDQSKWQLVNSSSLRN